MAIDQGRRDTERHLFSRAVRHETESLIASARWSDPDKLKSAAKRKERPFYFGRSQRDPSTLFLGVLESDDVKDPDGVVPIGWRDNRHVVTIAGSRAGKGQSAIIPNLHLYQGSVVCVDPKGENAAATASVRETWHRQDVFALDPFKASGVAAKYNAAFNPLEELDLNADEVLEDIRLIADSLVVAQDAKDAHWDESARSLLEALILFVLTDPRVKDKSLVTVRQLLMSGAPGAARKKGVFDLAYQTGVWFPPQVFADHQLDAFGSLLGEMSESQHPKFGPIIRGEITSLQSMAPEERGSVLSNARRNTKFIDGVPMTRTLSSGGRQFKFSSLKAQGPGATVFIVLPARYMGTHARWIRMLVSCLMIAVERSGPVPASKPPVLAILDEFPVLGYMQLLETATGYMAGFGLKLWSIIQDLGQLKRHYPNSWETFLGNAGLRQFFGNTDDTTLNYIAKQLGETEVDLPSHNETSSSTKTSNNPSMADRARLLAKQSASGAADDDAFFASTSDQDGSTSGSTLQRTKTPLLNADEVARLFSRESQNQLLLFSGFQPTCIKRVDHYRLGTAATNYWQSLLK